MGPRKHVLGGDAHWRHLANTTEPCAAAMLATCYNYFQFSNAIQGANAWTLWSSPLALCYSAAECCAPVWSLSTHTGLTYVQLNASMRLIFGTVCPTPLSWLPVLANIEPPPLRRKAISASKQVCRKQLLLAAGQFTVTLYLQELIRR